MAREKPKKATKVDSTFADKWEPENVGDELEGEYLGSEQVEGGRSDDGFRVYHIQGEDGKRWSVAGAYLESIMKQVPRGTYIWITYKGTQKVKKGSMALFEVVMEDGVKKLDAYESNK